METDQRYKVLFYVGCAWNFVIATTLFVLTGSLPAMIGIEAPRYPLFIHFNLISIYCFGFMQWIIARDPRGHRSFVKLLMWAKLSMGAAVLDSMVVDPPAWALIGFLAPGIVVDVLFGLMFWRFLVYARPQSPLKPESLHPVAV